MGAAAVLLALSTPAAAADRRASVVTTAALSASNNPLLSTRGNAEAMIAELTLNPVLTSETATSKVQLSGTIGERRYSRLYSSVLHGSAEAAAMVRRSERLQLNSSAHYRRDSSSELIEDLAGAISPRSVRSSFGADASAVWRLSELSTLSPSISGERVSFSRTDDLTGYRRFGGTLAYDRQLSEHTKIGASGGVIDFRFAGGGSASVASANATFARQISSTLDVHAALGLERSTFDSSAGDLDIHSRTVLFAGNGHVCNRGQRTNLCATASLASQADVLGSLQRTISAGLTYDRRLAEHSRIGLSASYRRSTGSQEAGNSNGIGQLSYLQAGVNFDRLVYKSLTLNAFLNYRSRRGSGSADAGYAGFSLRWTWGDIDHG